MDPVVRQPYLKAFPRLQVAEGRMAATRTYRVSYLDGRLEAKVEGAKLAVDKLALAREGVAGRFAALGSLRLEGVVADLVRRDVAVAALRMQDGRLELRRDAKG